jgi:hypothetical protein
MSVIEEPELVTLIPEEEEDEPPPSVTKLHTKIVVNLVLIAGLKIATGFAIRRLVKDVRKIDLLYPEHLDRINWKDFR